MRCTLLTRWSMVLAIDILLGRGPRKEMLPQLQAKETKLRLY